MCVCLVRPPPALRFGKKFRIIEHIFLWKEFWWPFLFWCVSWYVDFSVERKFLWFGFTVRHTFLSPHLVSHKTNQNLWEKQKKIVSFLVSKFVNSSNHQYRYIIFHIDGLYQMLWNSLRIYLVQLNNGTTHMLMKMNTNTYRAK